MTQKETVKWGLHLKTIEKCYRDLETLVNNFLLITNVAKTSVLDVAGAVDPPMILKISFF